MTYIFYCLVLSTVTALDLYAVTHPSYSGKILYGYVVSSYVLFNASLTGKSTPMLEYLNRPVLDSKCRWNCFLSDNLECKTFQTYWTRDGSFYCELLNVPLCHACSALVNQGTHQLAAQVWEVKHGYDSRPSVPCAAYPDWKVKGNCSECDKTGYYGRNCSLRSSCASYYYEPGTAPGMVNLNQSVFRTVRPCFTRGESITISCRGQYTRWFLSKRDSTNKWWNETENITGTFYLEDLPNQMQLAKEILGSRGLSVLLVYYFNTTRYFLKYGNFSLGPNGTLNLGANLSPEHPDGLNTPVTNAPLLQISNQWCSGLMWLTNQSNPHNDTHIDSCALPTILFGPNVKWAGKDVYFIAWFVNIDYFQCPDD